MLAGHSGYDIVVPTSEPTFSRLIRAAALLPLDKAKLPNLAGEDPALLKRVATSDPGNKYGAIYLWGTIGLRRNPVEDQAAVAECAAGQLGPAAEAGEREGSRRVRHHHDGQRDGRDPVGAEIPAHRDPSSTDAKDLADVEKVLMAIRPYIRTFASGGAVEAVGRRADLPGDELLRRRHPGVEPRSGGQAGGGNIRRTEGVHPTLVRYAGDPQGRAAPRSWRCSSSTSSCSPP